MIAQAETSKENQERVQRLKAIKDRLGLSVEDLSREIDGPKTLALYKFLNGKVARPNRLTLRAIDAYIGRKMGVLQDATPAKAKKRGR